MLGPLGAGGMGEVYRARDTRLGREVAIKAVKTPYTERFEREARAISALTIRTSAGPTQDPKNMVALMYIGMAYLTAGDSAKAREALSRARMVEPKNDMLSVQWAVLLALEGKREEGLRGMDAEVLKYGELIPAASNVAEFAVLGERATAVEWPDRREPRFREIVEGIRSRRAQRAASVR